MRLELLSLCAKHHAGTVCIISQTPPAPRCLLGTAIVSLPHLFPAPQLRKRAPRQEGTGWGSEQLVLCKLGVTKVSTLSGSGSPGLLPAGAGDAQQGAVKGTLWVPPPWSAPSLSGLCLKP